MTSRVPVDDVDPPKVLGIYAPADGSPRELAAFLRSVRHRAKALGCSVTLLMDPAGRHVLAVDSELVAHWTRSEAVDLEQLAAELREPPP